MATDIIFNLVVAGAEEQNTKLGQLNAELKALAEQRKKLNDFTGQGIKTDQAVARALGENTRKTAELKEQKRQLEQAVRNEVRANQSATGSYNELQARTAQLRQQLLNLPNAFQKNNKEAARLKKEIFDNTERLKAFDKEINQNFRNVGNYQEAIKGAALELGFMNTPLGRSVQLFKTVAPAINTTGVAFRFLLGPIGLLLTALGALVAFFTRTERGAEKLQRVVRQLGAGFDVILDRVARFGEGLASILSGDFQKGFDQIRQSVKGVGDELQREIRLSGQLKDAEEALEDREIAFIERRARLEARVEQLREEATAIRNTDRAKAIELDREALRVQNEVFQEEIGIAKERARILTEQTALAEGTDDELRAAAEARAEAVRLETELAKKNRTILSELVGLEKRENKDLEKSEAALEKQREEQAKREIEREQEKAALLEEITKKSEDARLNLIEDATEKKIAAADLAFSRELENLREKAELFPELESQIDALLEELETEHQANITAIRKDATEKQTENLEREAQKQVQIEQSIADAQLAITNAKIDIASGAADTLGKIAEGNINAQRAAFLFDKALAAAQIIINLQAEISRIAAFNAQLGPAGIPLTVAQSVAARIRAFAGLATIAGTVITQKFEDGGIAYSGGSIPAQGGMITGRSHSEGGVKFYGGEAQRGEAYILNVNGSPLLRELASQINVMGGGKPFAGRTKTKFQTGGIATAPRTDNISAILRRELANLRVINVASETEAVNNRVAKIRNIANGR